MSGLLGLFDPTRWVLGVPFLLPADLLLEFPELAAVTWRRGGLMLRIGGWCLRRATVSGFTWRHSVSIAERAPLAPELLLHELRHVHQFESDTLFPLRYVWSSLRFGYTMNPYEADARDWAARRLAGGSPIA